jgi:hypothetical protein
MGLSGQRHAPAALYPFRYPLVKRLGGPQSRSGRRAGRKILCHCRGSNPGSPDRCQTLYCLSYRGSKKVENIFFKSTYDYTKYLPMSSVFQTESEALLHWTTEVIFKLCIVNLCRLSRKSDLYWENVRSTSHDTSLAYLWHTMSLTFTSFRSSESTISFSYNAHGISHMILNSSFLLKHERKFSFTASAFGPLTLISLSWMSLVSFTVYDNRFVVFSNFVTDCDIKMKFAWM